MLILILFAADFLRHFYKEKDNDGKNYLNKFAQWNYLYKIQ